MMFQWDDKYIYLIMEYCSGGDLFTFIKNKTVLSEKDARKFLRQLGILIIVGYQYNYVHKLPRQCLLELWTTLSNYGVAKHTYYCCVIISKIVIADQYEIERAITFLYAHNKISDAHFGY